MDGLIKFSDYDIFGYLVSGLAVLGLADLTFGTHFVFVIGDWKVADAVLVIVAGYVIGHIIAAAATLVIDRFFVHTLLGKPDNILMRWTEPDWKPGWRRWVLGEYFIPLPANVWERVVARAGVPVANAQKNMRLGQELFWQAWAFIKQQPIPYARMDSFLRLYGFCRQFCFVSLLAAAAFAWRIWIAPDVNLRPQPVSWWVLAAAVVGFAMFSRYLKFLRLYGQEVFITYADGAPTKADA